MKSCTTSLKVQSGAEIKFFDGRYSGYSPVELAELKKWLILNNPKAMRGHFLKEILKYREEDKQAFIGSQLDALFKELIQD